MKLFLYSSILESPRLKSVPTDWLARIHLAGDKRIVAIDESIASRNYNAKAISQAGLKDVYILQDSFLSFLSNAHRFDVTLMNVCFDTDVDEDVLSLINNLFREGDLHNALKTIKHAMNEFDCDIKSITFFDKRINEIVEVTNSGVVSVFGNKDVTEWFKTAYYFYVLSDYSLPKEARGLLQ